MSSILYPTGQGAGNWEPEGEVCLQQVGAEVLPWEIQKHFMGISVCYVSLSFCENEELYSQAIIVRCGHVTQPIQWNVPRKNNSVSRICNWIACPPCLVSITIP